MKRQRAFAYTLVALVLVVGIIAFGYQYHSRLQKLPSVGHKLSGFTVEERSYIKNLSAETITLKHNKSGATVLFVMNDDENRSFDISYRTYYTDESDVPHVFEHAVLGASEKYPSKDLFFDLFNNTYNTFVNAQTTLTATNYLAASKSETQLQKLMDAYLSCMVAPSVLENENYFKREALRYELFDQDSPITLAGTVFSEDGGSATDIGANAMNNTMDALYPNQVSSCMIGRATENFRTLTYENMKKAFDTYYSFDNSLIVIYGKTDYRALLEFLDSEYLSKAENKHTDFSTLRNESEEQGFVETSKYVPAYQGDRVEGAAQIDYAISLYSYSWEDLLKLDLFTDMLNNEASPLNRRLREAGIHNRVVCALNLQSVKPYLTFTLSDTDESQKDTFKRVIDSSLAEIKKNGFDAELCHTVSNRRALNDSLIREQSDVGVNITQLIVAYWASSGRTDFFEQASRAYEEIVSDTDENWIKDASAKLMEPSRSALVVSVPKPGLAEENIAARERYLADLKSSMNQEDLQKLIQDTQAFQAWNASDGEHANLAIGVKDLPEPEKPKDLSHQTREGIDYYTYPIKMDKVGYYRFDFDISNVKKEDLYYVKLISMLLGDMRTEKYDAKKARMLFDNYLGALNVEYTYVPLEDNTAGKPSLCLSWTGLSDDYEKSLSLLLDLLTHAKYDDRDQIISIMERYLPDYDHARPSDTLSLAFDVAMSQSMKSIAFHQYMTNQDSYLFMKNELEKLKNDPNYILEFENKLHEITSMIIQKDGMRVFSAVAPQKAQPITEVTNRLVSSLPSNGVKPCFYDDIFVLPPASGIIIESEDQANILEANIGSTEFSGTCLPFLEYINSDLILPKVRFENGAYSALGQYMPGTRSLIFWSINDPKIDETYHVYESVPDFLSKANITQDKLNSCIMSAYGNLTRPSGEIDMARTVYSRKLNGIESDEVNEIIQQVKETKLEDQQNAAHAFEQLLKTRIFVTVGNEQVLKEHANQFDTLLNYKHA